TIKVPTWGTDTIEALQLVINGATQQINFVQPIDWLPPAAPVQPVQSTPAAKCHRLPRINYLYVQLQRATMFTKLNLSKGYFHIALAPESRLLMMIIMPYGLFQYKCLRMGLTDIASVFQRLVSQTLAQCKGCISNLEDILVFSSMAMQHNE
uniref:Reverse transcriptase n=1 Tax=Romanomermis culicivorax TaxID=13658 RepID=A0A915J0K0_ROMCU